MQEGEKEKSSSNKTQKDENTYLSLNLKDDMTGLIVGLLVLLVSCAHIFFFSKGLKN